MESPKTGHVPVDLDDQGPASSAAVEVRSLAVPKLKKPALSMGEDRGHAHVHGHVLPQEFGNLVQVGGNELHQPRPRVARRWAEKPGPGEDAVLDVQAR